MREKPDVWMPLFIGDYLADTSRLTTEQHGAYLLLIMDYWRQGPIPNDPCTLAQITKLSADAWSNAQALLMHFFKVGDDGCLHHKRIDAELASAAENQRVSSERAQKAANARWGKQNNAPSNAQAMHKQCLSNALHLHLHLKNLKTKTRRRWLLSLVLQSRRRFSSQQRTLNPSGRSGRTKAASRKVSNPSVRLSLRGSPSALITP